ncbi:MAG: hypothetical protein GWM98_18580 [Nitrospinaceae bacterium]|nr:hypothetical protein [Nitrospinaceae bacterium]NIS86578.1 hypothetical protein [Nitrospinaceae bacterium]NIT83412.1 hypothetical protein [Nitrospinaceae bacterium]NIU97779.1 hypothetical protein [Nitrospinaceae bacterium]NIY16754.1 hypothetical protein [Nitrospinaceae bacterium]
MFDFSHIKYGVLLALTALLFGGALGLSFGCCEEDLKGILKSNADRVLADKYQGQPENAKKVVDKSWIYWKRAHLHSQAMGVVAIALSLMAAGLGFSALLQRGVSILSGLGSLGYGIFWLTAGGLAPGMGGTHPAKESVALIAQASGGAFFIAGAAVFATLVYRMFLKKSPGVQPGAGP